MLRRSIFWLVIIQALFFSSCTDFLLFQEAVGYKKAQTFNITFDSQGATIAANPATMTVTDPATKLVALPTAPEKTGYTFGGWFTEVNGAGTEFTASSTVNASVTVYVKWTPVTYTITYYLNDGTQNARNPASYTIETDTITLANPTRSAYYFGGWFDNVGLAGDAITTIAKGSIENKTFWAKWTLVPVYIITFDSQGATIAANPATMTVTDPATTITTLPSAPEKTGYTFGGWFTELNGLGTAFTASTPVSETLTVYAKWIPIVYTITYYLNDGTQNAANPTSYTIETATITLATPTRTGYAFGGWYSNVGLTGTTVTSIPTGSTTNREYWAAWTPNFSISVTTNKPDDVGTRITVGGSVSVAKGTAVTLSVSENFTSYEWLLDGSTNVGTTQSVTIGTADLSAGVHLVVLLVTDSAGYEYTSQVYIEVTN